MNKQQIINSWKQAFAQHMQGFDTLNLQLSSLYSFMGELGYAAVNQNNATHFVKLKGDKRNPKYLSLDDCARYHNDSTYNDGKVLQLGLSMRPKYLYSNCQKFEEACGAKLVEKVKLQRCGVNGLKVSDNWVRLVGE